MNWLVKSGDDGVMTLFKLYPMFLQFSNMLRGLSKTHFDTVEE